MTENQGDQAAKIIGILLLSGITGFLLLHIVMIIAVLLVIAATAASTYAGLKLGYQAATQGEIWQSSRIATHQKLHAQREKEHAYFQQQGLEHMTHVVDMHYEDKEREMYKDKSTLDDSLNLVRKIKDVLK